MEALPADHPGLPAHQVGGGGCRRTGAGAGPLKGAGRIHDSDRDPGHFADLDDDGRLLGGAPKLIDLPPTRAAYETAPRAVGQDSWKAGYLPYAIIDGHQQLVRDFATYRVLIGDCATREEPRRDWPGTRPTCAAANC